MASRNCTLVLRGRAILAPSKTQTESPVLIQRRNLATALTPTTPSAASAVPLQAPSPSLKPARVDHRGLVLPAELPKHIQPIPSCMTTVLAWPTLEPLRLASYPHTHLALPLRRDILHRAVVYEGDGTRQGTASTKWRHEVHGSKRKLRPQKGTGRARLGDKKSPMLKGGGVAHGPKPRDFSTELPRKLYHKAWRMALSYRWRRGQLIVVDKLGIPKSVRQADRGYWLRWALEGLGWCSGKEGHSFFITATGKDGTNRGNAFTDAVVQSEGWGRVRTSVEVDVKNLLELKRLVVEEEALWQMLKAHQSDLKLSLIGTAPRIDVPTRKLINPVPAGVHSSTEAQVANAVAAAQHDAQLGDFASGMAAGVAAGSFGAITSSSLESGITGGQTAELSGSAERGDELDEFYVQKALAEAERVAAASGEDEEFDDDEDDEDDEEFDEDDDEDGKLEDQPGMVTEERVQKRER